jgi:antitoxin VapB
MDLIQLERRSTMHTATVITHGHNQSVQLPEGFQMSSGEVYVKRLGKSVLLIPKDADRWELMEGSLAQFTDDFMRDRNQPPQQHRNGPFE